MPDRFRGAPGLAPVPDRLPLFAAALTAGAESGLHSGAQGYVSLGGQPVADFGFGAASPDAMMTPDTLNIWMSSCKPVTAVALAQAWEEGLCDLDDPVARHLPEFGTNGKEALTLRHLLTHTGGFRALQVDWATVTFDEILAAVCASPREADWEPGKRAGYHQATSWFALAGVVARLTGEPFGERVRREIYRPIGMRDSWMGMPPAEHAAYGARIGWMFDTSPEGKGKPHGFHDPRRMARAMPSGGGWGPIRELGYFYEMLLARGERAGARLLSPVAVEALTAPHRVGMMDDTFKTRLDWGLGFIVNTAPPAARLMPYGYGAHASPRTFGHGGWQSSVGMADPVHGLAVALVFNGTPGEGKHTRRIRDALTALYEDLGLAAATG